MLAVLLGPLAAHAGETEGTGRFAGASGGGTYYGSATCDSGVLHLDAMLSNPEGSGSYLPTESSIRFSDLSFSLHTYSMRPVSTQRVSRRLMVNGAV